jgi:hypothetical protein
MNRSAQFLIPPVGLGSCDEAALAGSDFTSAPAAQERFAENPEDIDESF